MSLTYISKLGHALRRGPTRRQLLQSGGWLTLGGLLTGRLSHTAAAAVAGAPQASTQAAGVAAGRSIYERLGVRPLINARGTVTVVGASRTLPEVQAAMEAAAREYVQLDDLAEGVGRRLAELTGAEWGAVTSGASAALTLATAAAIAGGDPDKLAQLPDLRGLKDEVVMPAYSRTAYDHALKVVGARIVEVADREALEAALGPRTAMISVLAGSRSQNGTLSLNEIASLARPRGIPVLVDAAADELVVPNPYLSDGADLVAYSGGKCLRGPQCAGLLLGRMDLVKAAWVHSAPHHGLGRGFKVGREEVMGMLAAVEAWMHTRDHAAEQQLWTSWMEHIAGRLATVPGVTTSIRQPQGLSNRSPTLHVQWDQAVIPLAGDDVVKLLWDGAPRIAVSGAGSFLPFPPDPSPSISITAFQLEAGEERVIADRVHAILSAPPTPTSRRDPPTIDVSGQWDVTLTFVSGTGTCSFALEQTGTTVSGTHYGRFATRDLAGTVHGRDLLLRSSYTQNGVRLNYTFMGTASADAIEGQVGLGEYGTATWTAVRRTYLRPGAGRVAR
jgi:D-glucosaminate-6-phosphate ammonia-lyase